MRQYKKNRSYLTFHIFGARRTRCIEGLLGILFAFPFVSTVLAANADLVVRWHGDYYQHKWIQGIPGGTPSSLRESRWFRGGNQHNAVQHLLLDEDGDGALDDSRVYFPFSLDVPLNPPGQPVNPGGVFYHEDLNSAKFYGGISASFFNYQTDRIQQAFIENDGAGGDLDDVGYHPSPYVPGGAQFDEAFSARIQGLRNSEGRYSKNHQGPQEDFAINIYRPDLPHPLNPADDPSDNLAAFHAAFLWKKEDFLEVGGQQRVTLDVHSSFSFESTRWWENVGEARWIIQDGDQQFYISQFSVAGKSDIYGHVNEFLDPLQSQWATYNPTEQSLDFDQNAEELVWLDPVAAGLFSDIQAFGLFVENDTPSSELTKFTFDEVRFQAKVVDHFDTADFNTDGSVNSLDLATWQTALADTDAGDADGDGDTDGNDFLLWQTQHNETQVGLAAPLSTTVPEPRTIFLLALAFSPHFYRPRGRPLLP